MSAKAICEADGKAILNYHLTRAPVIKPTPLPPPSTHNPPPKLASIYFPEDAAVEDVLNQAEVTYPWLLQAGAKFVAKPDQLIKRRGKSGLLALNKTWPEAKAWVAERARKVQKVEHTHGVLSQFLVEPFVPHPQGTEYYININSVRDVSVIPLLSFARGGLVPSASAESRALSVRRELDSLDREAHSGTTASRKSILRGAKRRRDKFCDNGDWRLLNSVGLCQVPFFVDSASAIFYRTTDGRADATRSKKSLPLCPNRRGLWLLQDYLHKRLFPDSLQHVLAQCLILHSDVDFGLTRLTLFRATGSSSPTRAVSMLVMLMPRPRSFSFPWTCRSTLPTRSLPARS